MGREQTKNEGTHSGHQLRGKIVVKALEASLAKGNVFDLAICTNRLEVGWPCLYELAH